MNIIYIHSLPIFTSEEWNRIKWNENELVVGPYRVLDMRICNACFYPHGKVEDTKWNTELYQRCCCEKGDEKKWPNADFNEALRICDCCGKEVLTSGSRWSVWFCDECKQMVMERNTTYGFTLVPIGRHSMMAGMMLSGKDLKEKDRKEMGKFLKGVSGLFDRMDILHDFKKVRMKKLMECIQGEDMDLIDYLKKVNIYSDIHKRKAVEDLYDHFERTLKTKREPKAFTLMF